MNLPSRSSIESAELLRRIEAGDNEATSLVFERYLERLTRLAQSRLAARIATRVDPEDIVMSAYRSFFVAARTGRFELNRGGDLWRLLAEMTLHKLYRQVERHQTKRRSVESERPLVDIDHVAAPNSGNEPTHEEVVATADELEAVFRQLPENGRHALELRLQGYEHGEIAERLKCSERTVGRLLTEARRVMVSRAGSNFIPSAARAVATARQAMPSSAVPFDLSNIGHREDWSDFVLQAQIGIGAMGKVYRAFQKSRQREVAVKFLKKHLTRESSNIQRFLRELQMVAGLEHPGIVAIHGAGMTPAGGVFLVMDLVRGQNLEQVYRSAQCDWNKAVAWIIEAAHIVNFANQHEVVHCDLKPSNLLLDDTGRIRATDFGLASRVSDAESKSLAGTPAFMAPEQVDRCWGEISPRTDVWGLGAVLFFLLSGRPPHCGSDVAEVLASVVSGTPVDFSWTKGSSAPQSVIDALRRCLAKSPADRYASALALANALADSVVA